MHATLAELRHIAGIEASKISFDWDMMETYPTVREELLASFEYAQGIITTLEARYTMLMDSERHMLLPSHNVGNGAVDDEKNKK